MAFKLEVRFSGLCLYVMHPTRDDAAVLLPDARLNGSLQGAGAKHLDGTPAVPHVGYMSIDLAHLGFSPPKRPMFNNGVRGGQFDAIYRFDQQQLDFGLASASQKRKVNEIPNFKEFASSLKLRSDLFASAVASPLLLRTMLTGGKIEPSSDVDLKDRFMMSTRLNKGKPSSIEQSSPGSTTWTRDVEADGLTITVTDFDGQSNPLKLPLKPIVDGADRVIRIHIANLCSENPLEWDQFKIRGLASGEDSDFKWYYRLFEPVSGTFDTLLDKFFLPAPFLVKVHNPQAFGGEAGDCGHGLTEEEFPQFPA